MYVPSNIKGNFYESKTLSSGRGGQFSSVLIDCAGGMIGIIIGRKLFYKI